MTNGDYSLGTYRYCLKCGTEAVSGASFCGTCGSALAKGSADRVPAPINNERTSHATSSGADPQPLSKGDRSKAPWSPFVVARQLKSWISRKPKRALIRVWLGTIAGLFVLAFITDRIGPHSTPNTYVVNSAARDEAGIAVALLLAPFIIWAFVASFNLGRSTMREAQVASQPIPSPQEIAIALEAEWNRTPTVEEVAAVHQMLASRKNEALVNAGIGFGAIYLMHKSGSGR